MKTSCKIIEDLLPMYHDGICSEESAALIEEHLHECPNCSQILASLRGEIEFETAHPANDLKPLEEIQQRISREKKRFGRRNALIAAVLVIAIIPIFWLGWNQFTGSGICFTNVYEYRIGHKFMRHLSEGNYEKAYEYVNIDVIRERWLQTWFDEDKLIDLKSDGQAMFCAYGQKLEEAGGIDSYKYVGIHKGGIDEQGGVWYRLVFNIQVGDRSETFSVDVSQGGVDTFGGHGSFWDDPLAQFSLWHEYLWQDYEGCYFDPDLKQYVYYDKEE